MDPTAVPPPTPTAPSLPSDFDGESPGKIMQALQRVEGEVRELRGAFELRNEDGSKKYKELIVADSTTQHETRRLERRIEEVEHQLRDDRKERRREQEDRDKDRQDRDRTKHEISGMLTGFERHAQQATSAAQQATAATEQATSKLEEATQTFEKAALKIDSLDTENKKQDQRQDDFEKSLEDIKTKVVEGNQTTDAVANELNVRPAQADDDEEGEKTHRPAGAIQTLTRQQRTGLLLLILANVTTTLVSVLTRGH